MYAPSTNGFPDTSEDPVVIFPAQSNCCTCVYSDSTFHIDPNATILGNIQHVQLIGTLYSNRAVYQIIRGNLFCLRNIRMGEQRDDDDCNDG